MKPTLTPQLVPKPLWGKNAHDLLGRGAAWKAIRRDALNAAGQCCSICGSEDGQLSCHEKWLYDDDAATATLIRVEIHCGACDLATHAGRAIKLGKRDVVLRQICKVNGCTESEANGLIKAALLDWEQRSRKKWKIDVAAPLLQQYPQLSVLIDSH